MPNQSEHKISHPDEMAEISNMIISEIKTGDIITLRGNLGAGKTTLSKYIIHALTDSKNDVTSPTFNLVATYDSGKDEIWHFDLYRLENQNDAFELGIEDAFERAISIIEWPEIIEDILPHDKIIDVKISYGKTERERLIKITDYRKN